MIKDDELTRRWKRSLWHLAVADIVCMAVLATLLHKRLTTAEGPSLPLLAVMLCGLIVANVAFYGVARSIKAVVKREFGQD